MTATTKGPTVGIDWLVSGADADASLTHRVAWIEQFLTWVRARGGADAVGRMTTSSVVTSIFMIIMADAFFSLIFYFGD